jgi:hypothetical protein
MADDPDTAAARAGRRAWAFVAALALSAICASALVESSRPVLAGPGEASASPAPTVSPSAQPRGKILSTLLRRCTATDDSELRKSCRRYAKSYLYGCEAADDLAEYQRCERYILKECETSKDFDTYIWCAEALPCPTCFKIPPPKALWDLLFPGKPLWQRE